MAHRVARRLGHAYYVATDVEFPRMGINNMMMTVIPLFWSLVLL